MCGRFGIYAELDELADQFDFDLSGQKDTYRPSWNVSPTMHVLAVLRPTVESHPSGNVARMLRWGMQGARKAPSGKSQRPLFNARAETVDELPSFRQAFHRRRCILPAHGFYEWKATGTKSRAPVWIQRKDGAPLGFAGIWSRERIGDEYIDTCAVLTCAANSLVSPIHHRMPVILPPHCYRNWLDADAGIDGLQSLIQTVEWHDMEWYPVSTKVNNASNDDPSLVERVSTEMQSELEGLALS